MDNGEAAPKGTPTHAVLAGDPGNGFMLEVTRRSVDTRSRCGDTSIDRKDNVTFATALP